mmetsp:Transcript_34035/g.105310  ORF Transcript_34035/g.105310 Transcript_34035/m.105310 type:complete len:276 (-) Transcript_34035:29-856(-)
MNSAVLLAVLVARPAAPLAAKRGFGAKPKAKKAKPALDGAARRCLDEHGGDVDLAQAARFQARLDALREDDPALFADVVRTRRGDATARGRDALLALTWDTVADYLPTAGVDPEAERRLAEIASHARGSCLDVGCGDGALARHLGDLGGYVGLDLSARMVRAARKKHPDLRFERAGFFDAGGADGPFDTILFVASLQFFPDVSAVLAACDEKLAPGGRVVVAHVRGAAFVRDEKRGNPSLVRELPAADELAAGPFRVARAGADLEDFYLVVLERK